MAHGEHPAVGLSARFAQIIGGLCGLLGHYEARERTAGPFVFLIRALLRRRLGRLEALVARFHAGTLKVTPPPAASRGAPPGASVERPWDPMPRNRAWLWHLVPGVDDYIARFEAALADPEMAALLAAAPQAGRLLRPLWWMMSPNPLPAMLRTPLRRRPSSTVPPDSPACDGAHHPCPPRPEPSRRQRGRPREVRAFAFPENYVPVRG